MRKSSYININSRLEWITDTLRAGEMINCTIISHRFEVTIKTAQRDINLLRRHFRMRIQYDSKRRSYVFIRHHPGHGHGQTQIHTR